MDMLRMGPVIVRQRRAMDCGLAALASFTCISYEDLYVHLLKFKPTGVKDGLLMRDLLEVSRRAGKPLKALHWKKVRDLIDRSDDPVSGVLGLNWKRPIRHNGNVGHWVCVRNRVVLDPSDNPPRAHDIDLYLVTEEGMPGWMLVE